MKRGILKDSRDRTLRRNLSKVAMLIRTIALSMISLDMVPKLPLECASDVLCLCLFVQGLLKQGWTLETTCVLFLAAHHMRTPELVAKLLELSGKGCLSRPSEAARFLKRILAQAPFHRQKDGRPFWIAFSRFHFGSVQFMEWLSDKQELNLLGSVRDLCFLVSQDCSVSQCVASLQELPHAGTDQWKHVPCPEPHYLQVHILQ